MNNAQNGQITSAQCKRSDALGYIPDIDSALKGQLKIELFLQHDDLLKPFRTTRKRNLYYYRNGCFEIWTKCDGRFNWPGPTVA